MTGRHRILFILVKVCVSAGLIYWIVDKVDVTAVWASLSSANPLILLLAFSLFFVGYYITALRWQVLLAAQGVVASIQYLFQSFMVAIFFNNLLPSTIGGDLSRMYDSWRLGRRKDEAVSVVLVDRLLGVSALLAYALCAVLVSPTVRERLPLLLPLIAVGVAAAAVAVWALFGQRRSLTIAHLRIHKLEKISAVTKLVDRAFNAFKDKPHVLRKAILLSLLLQLNVIIHFYLLTRALDISIPITAMFVIIPISIVIMMLPISINAIGVREVTFVYFFTLFGASDSKSLALAWVAFAFVVLQGILGGIVFALRKPA